MAQKIDPKNLTLDAKTLLNKASVQDRRDILNNPAAQSFLESLTPTEYAKYFPFAKALPDIGKSLSGGTAGAGVAGRSVPSGTAAPVMGRPQAPQYVKPQPSTNASQNSFLDYIKKITGKSTGFQLDNNISKTQSSIDSSGYVNKEDFYKQAVTTFRNSPLNGFVPKDGDKYGIKKGTPEEWANLAMRTAKVESSFRTTTTNLKDEGGSFGLFQFGFHYGINKDNWKDPQAQLNAFVTYSKQWVVNGGGYIMPPSNIEGVRRYFGYGGFGAAFSTFRDNKVNSNSAWAESSGIESNLGKIKSERSSQSSEMTGLTPESPVPGKQVEEKPKFKYSAPYVEKQAEGLGPEINQRLSRLQQLHGEFTITSTTGGVMGPGTGHSRGSLHYSGQAVDIHINSLSQEERMRLVENARRAGFNRIGLANDHLHLDMRPGSFTVFQEGNGASAFGISVKDLQKKLDKINPTDSAQQVPSATQKTEIQKPDDFNSWNPKLQEYFNSLPPTIQQDILNENENLKKQGKNINDIYDKAVKDGILPSRAAQETATAIINTPPGEMPQVNPQGFGVGMIHGEQKYTAEQEAQRKDFVTGKIKFSGFENQELANIEFQAGSGGRIENKPSVPSGTYSLSPQATGPVISGYYSRYGLTRQKVYQDNNQAFGRVYNVGLPGSPTVAGYDPKVQRTRTQIQIHSNVSKDIDKLISSGCLTVSPDEYPRLVENIEKARKESKSGISLVVQNNKDGTSSFTIMPSGRATNPIPVNTAVKNFQKTGNMNGIITQQAPQPVSPTIPTGVTLESPVPGPAQPQQAPAPVATQPTRPVPTQPTPPTPVQQQVAPAPATPQSQPQPQPQQAPAPATDRKSTRLNSSH